MALPDDLSPDRGPGGEHPCRYCVHGYHLLVLSHGFRESSSGHRGPPPGFAEAPRPPRRRSRSAGKIQRMHGRSLDKCREEINSNYRWFFATTAGGHSDASRGEGWALYTRPRAAVGGVRTGSRRRAGGPPSVPLGRHVCRVASTPVDRDLSFTERGARG